MLYHFSENPTVNQFVPRLSPVHPDWPPLVWAIDHDHAPLYFFPRNCPRVAFWKRPDSAAEDIERFFLHSRARMVITIEGAWAERIQRADLYVYEFPPDGFLCIDEGAGYFGSERTVEPCAVRPVGDLIAMLVHANVELRITPSLYPLHDAVSQSTLQYSMIRMRNAIR